jgi:hypothetical protein
MYGYCEYLTTEKGLLVKMYQVSDREVSEQKYQNARGKEQLAQRWQIEEHTEREQIRGYILRY